METMIEPKFKIGQKVFYTDFTAYYYDFNGNNEAYRGKSSHIADDIVLYGTIQGIESTYDGLKYSITVEEYDGLEENNQAVDYRKRDEQTWNLDALEDNVFSLNDLESAKEQALKNHKERIKYEKKLEKERNAENTASNAQCLYDFLLREYTEFDIKYTKEQLDAFYQLISSPRMDLTAYDFRSDLNDGYSPKYEWCERGAIDKDKQYVELLRNCLNVEGYKEL